MRIIRNLLKVYLIFIGICITGAVFAMVSQKDSVSYNAALSAFAPMSLDPPPDTSGLKLPMKNGEGTSPLHMKDPPNIKTEVNYNPSTNDYTITKKVGDVILESRYMSFKEYQDWEMDRLMSEYWNGRAKGSGLDTRSSGGVDKFIDKYIPGLSGISDKVSSFINLGIGDIEIRPTGSAEITFAVVHNKRDDPSIEVKNRSTTNFDFDMNIQANVMAKIGDNISFDFNYNTQAIFNFENKLKLKYEGKEDDILQLLEAGDVALTLPSSLIRGSQSLFGIKTKLKFGKTTVEAIFSEQKSESKNIVVQGGALQEPFNIKADEYEENKHYLLAQYFYDNYNSSLERLPIVNSSILITKMEVWRTNIGSAVEQNRNIVAFSDLGEYNPYMSPTIHSTSSRLPDGKRSNNLLSYVNKDALRNINSISSYLQGLGFVSGQDYEKLENARRLSSTEYTYNQSLGFLSLTQPLSADQVLGVAFQYQIIGDTTVYQVGEFSDEGVNAPNTLVVKLLKSSSINTRIPLWKLMMKNVYYLKSSQISQENFRLNILYEGDQAGVPTGYFEDGPKKGIPLIQVFGLDRMDFQMNPVPDGVFDFLDNASQKGGTIEAIAGRVYFPYIEPFGKDLRTILNDPVVAEKYCYDSLYTQTKSQAQQHPEKNKFYLEGFYKSAMGGEISLGMSVPQGSVKVTAGGIPLIENVDYTVDYVMGKVRILNEGILSSGTPINITNENNSLFSFTTKRMMGVRATHEIQKNFNIGATILNLHESPMIQKTIFGDEPISNTVFGFDMQFQKEVPLITKLIDALPGIQTKAPSTFTFNGEFAYFLPGMSSTKSSKGTSYIDDFEAAKTTYDLKGNYGGGSWTIASTPQDYNTVNPLFLETAPNTGLKYGFNRAKLAWYNISDIFYGRSETPKNITKSDQSKPYARRIYEQEVFPNKELVAGQPTYIREMNLAFYPSERGSYNYDILPTEYSAGVDENGELLKPESRWGGIMRKIENTDFESNNIEYIQFWVMDPFIETPNHKGGELYFNLGEISEDILKDGRKSYENGLPTGPEVKDVDTTIWGRVPKLQSMVNAFDNDPAKRAYQDVGLDGLSSTDEAAFFAAYLEQIGAQFGVGSKAYLNAAKDPSSDDYHYFRGTDYDDADMKINERYKYYNNTEGNAVTSDNSSEDYSTQGSAIPDVEDINKDNTLNETENYFQYVVKFAPSEMVIGKNYITDIYKAENIDLPDGTKTSCTWYQFKVPIRTPDKVVGNMESFQSIRFMRMFMRGFSQPIILRFASLELVRSEWRKYDGDLLEQGDYVPYTSNTVFNTATVNIEENGTRQPVPYVIPPGVDRERIYSSTTAYQGNEQSLSMHIENLADGDARAIYKNTYYDFRFFKKLKMFVHAERVFNNDNSNDGDLTVFIRLGADFTKNYYEYEVPLKYTPWNSSDPSAVWPEENDVEIDFERLIAVKENRNRKIRGGSVEYSQFLNYTEYDGVKKMTVLGSPNISSVKVIMIGIRNPKKQTVDDLDDMLPKSAEIWINELRLTDLNSKGGWAATALARTNLADLGDVSLYGAYTTSGYGSLDQKIADLNTENIGSLDFSTNLELGKFLPDKLGIHIPMHFDYSNTTASPEYNPLDPDVKLSNDLSTYPTSEERDSIASIVNDVTTRTNINFMNVRKDRVGKRALHPRFYQIENFDFSYAYSVIRNRNIDIEYDMKKQYKGGLGYNYSLKQAKSLKPFGKVSFLSDNAFAIVRDFELFYQPQSLGFRTEMLRDYQESKLRNKSTGLIIIEPTYFKQFFWNRQYDFQYSLTQNIKITYAANANARIDEPPGEVDSKAKDTIWKSIRNLGSMQLFTQKVDARWDIPINKLPYLDWVRVSADYNVLYTFTGTPKALSYLGNSIDNSTTLSLNGSFSFQNLYNKFDFIKKAYEKPRPQEQSSRQSLYREQQRTSAKDTVADTNKSALSENLKKVLNFSIRFLTGVKTASVSYSKTGGMTVPGFMPEAQVMGMSVGDSWAPGPEFVFGLENDQNTIMSRMLDNNWISTDSLMNNPFLQRTNETFRGQASIEPIKDLRIDLTFIRSKTENVSAYYKYMGESDGVPAGFVGPKNSLRTGSFSISIWSFSTAFSSDNQDHSNEVFKTFLSNRGIVANRLASDNPNTSPNDLVQDSVGNWAPRGYSLSSQQVLIPAFLAAYTGKDASGVAIDPFHGFPLPSWNLTYTGLSKVKALQKWFTNITLSHGYKSSYDIGSYSSDIRTSDYSDYDYGNEFLVYENGDFIPRDVIDLIMISEQFAPLLKIDLAFVNSLQGSFEYRKSRTLSLSFSNNQLTDVSMNTFAITLGYRFKDVAFTISSGGLKHDMKSDITIKGNFSWTDNKTVLRQIDLNTNQISTGSKVINAGLSAAYDLVPSKLSAKVFFETVINTPYISNSYPNSSTRGGFSFILTL